MNILLLDDEADFVTMLSKRLSKKGYTVSTATDGQTGLEIFLESPDFFDAVLTDIKMPVMDGIMFLNQIRKHDYDTPVIIMSGYDDMTQSIQALRLGAFDYLTKPIRLEQLYSTLNKLESILKASRKVIELLPYISGKIEISIPGKVKYIESVIAFIQRQVDPVCNAHGINVFNISLCLQEALGNAIIHGNLDIPSRMKEDSWETFEAMREERESDPEYGNKKVFIRYIFSPLSITLEVEDEGSGFDKTTLPDLDDPGTMVSSGRGLLYILTFMDHVDWNDNGNVIRMTKNLKHPKNEEPA